MSEGANAQTQRETCIKHPKKLSQRFDRTRDSNNIRIYNRAPSRYRKNIHHLGVVDNKAEMPDKSI